MQLDDFQGAALRTAIYPGRQRIGGLVYATLGLANEAGEVAGKLKKVIRDEQGAVTVDSGEALLDELGDVLWYVAVVADELGYDLETVARRNIDKLRSRKERGVLGGSGDNR